MNRKHQGQTGRQKLQTYSRGSRSNSENRPNYQQSGHEMSHSNERMHAGSQPRNFSGDSSWSSEDSGMNNSRNSSQTYRDTDYDLDGSTYGTQGRSPRPTERNFSGRMAGAEYGSTFNDYESNRSPLRYDRDEDTYSSRFSPDREEATSERFGYPSNMNAWSGSDRSFNSGHTPGRMGQEHELSSQHSYGDTGSALFGSFEEDRANRQDWGSQFGKGPKGYKRSDDRIKEDVCEALSRDHRIDASDIEVNVEKAMVTLSGSVDSRQAKRAAEMCIENLSGVDEVKNEIKVKKAGEAGHDSLHASGSNKTSMSNSTSNSTSKSSTNKSSGQI